ncbi:aldo/keto reductase [Enterococcus casseliflavus]|uniref:aldo/keto reductase n=1 Tax=Enterococcus casseliflavus TaxID=37734 RepID=UPI003D0EE87C
MEDVTKKSDESRLRYVILQETFTLQNKLTIPKIGLGTWQSSPEDAYNATKFAIQNGYRHVDTAAAYKNEEAVGKAVRDSGVAREEIFVTTKVPAQLKTYQEAVDSIDASLKKLDLGYIDLILIHAPRPWKIMGNNPENKDFYLENIDVWKALEEAYLSGKVKSIGVSNFDQKDLQNIFDHCDVKPMVNQFVYHIGRTNEELLAFCKDHEILVEGYSPIATGRLLDNDAVKTIAEAYGKSIPQLSIRYLLQKDILPLPKSVHEEYIADNAKVDFEISEEDMKKLDELQA